jgi:hypothetical protein
LLNWFINFFFLYFFFWNNIVVKLTLIFGNLDSWWFKFYIYNRILLILVWTWIMIIRLWGILRWNKKVSFGGYLSEFFQKAFFSLFYLIICIAAIFLRFKYFSKEYFFIFFYFFIMFHSSLANILLHFNLLFLLLNLRSIIRIMNRISLIIILIICVNLLILLINIIMIKIMLN